MDRGQVAEIVSSLVALAVLIGLGWGTVLLLRTAWRSIAAQFHSPGQPQPSGRPPPGSTTIRERSMSRGEQQRSRLREAFERLADEYDPGYISGPDLTPFDDLDLILGDMDEFDDLLLFDDD